MFFSILEYICLILFISKGSEALHTEINPGVTTTIGAPNVELWCSYIKDDGEQISYINMKAKNKTNDEYIQIATFYPPERNREADLPGDYLTGRVSLKNPTDESDKAILTFNQIQCVDDTDYICSVSYDINGNVDTKDTFSTSINVISTLFRPDQEEFESTGIIIGGIIAGLIILMVIVILLRIRRRRGVNVKLPDNPNQQCVRYSTGKDADIEQNNTNCTDVDGTCLNNIPNDTNDDLYNHLGNVSRNHTTSPGATGNIYDRVG